MADESVDTSRDEALEPEGTLEAAEAVPGAPAPDPAAGTGAVEEAIDPAQLVPVWLAGLVLVLLLAVMAIGGYAIRGVIAGDGAPKSSAELEIVHRQEQVDADPQDVSARLSLAFAYQQAERYDAALEAYDQVLEMAPGDTAANYNRGVVLRELGLEDKAEEAFWEVLEVEKDHALAAKALGDYYAGRGHYRSLVEAVRPAAEARPEMADLQCLMGLAYEKLGRKDWAEARYRMALKYVPDMKDARDGLERLGVKQ